MDVVRMVADLGGVASRWQILERGATEWELGRARHDGRLVRVRRAWYALPGADPTVVAAVRVGGKLSCVSLLRAVGVWVPPVSGVHVSVADNASRLRSARSRFVPLEVEPDGVVLHWRPKPGATTEARDSVAGAIQSAFACLDREVVVAVADSALRQRLVTRAELYATTLPREIVRLADWRSESGGESLVRLRLRALRLGFRSQVGIAGVGRVDFVVGDRLVIEVDGYAHHGSRDAFEHDRARDLALVARGYLVVRISYRQIEAEWPRIERAILAIVRSGRHRFPIQGQRGS